MDDNIILKCILKCGEILEFLDLRESTLADCGENCDKNCALFKDTSLENKTSYKVLKAVGLLYGVNS